MGYFSIGEAFSSAWKTFREAPAFFLGFQALLSVTALIFRSLEAVLTGTTVILGFPLALLKIGLDHLIYMKFLEKGFNIHYERSGGNGVDPDVGTWLKLYGASLLRTLLIIIGTIFFIIPGIYFAVKYVLFNFVIIDRETGVLESLSEAGELAKGNWWKLFLLSILTFFFSFSGLLLLVVGVFFTSSLSSLVWMHVYLQLKEGGMDEDTERMIDNWLEEQDNDDKEGSPMVAEVLGSGSEIEVDDEQKLNRELAMEDIEL